MKVFLIEKSMLVAFAALLAVAIVFFLVKSSRKKSTDEFPFVTPDLIDYDELLRENIGWQEKLIREQADFDRYISSLEEKKAAWTAFELSAFDNAPVIADLIISYRAIKATIKF